MQLISQSESKIRQDELIDLLKSLSDKIIKQNDVLEQAWIKFKHIYADNFRHQYSSLFHLVIEIGDSDGKMDFDILTTNIFQILQFVQQKEQENGRSEEDIHIIRSLYKLYDHLNLEIGRYNQYQRNDGSEDYSENIKELEVRVETTLDNLEESKKKVSSVQTELITVLGIFAAIIIAFSGSISVLGSALSGMQNAPFYKTVFFVLLCGFVLINAIFILLYMVGKLTNHSVFGERKHLVYLIILNVLIILMMAADIILWIFYPQLECLLLSKKHW